MYILSVLTLVLQLHSSTILRKRLNGKAIVNQTTTLILLLWLELSSYGCSGHRSTEPLPQVSHNRESLSTPLLLFHPVVLQLVAIQELSKEDLTWML